MHKKMPWRMIQVGAVFFRLQVGLVLFCACILVSCTSMQPPFAAKLLLHHESMVLHGIFVQDSITIS